MPESAYDAMWRRAEAAERALAASAERERALKEAWQALETTAPWVLCSTSVHRIAVGYEEWMEMRRAMAALAPTTPEEAADATT